MINELRVQTTDQNAGDGTVLIARAGRTGELFAADAQARYFDQVRRGNTFYACMQAIAALSVNSTTATGLIITNPPGNNKYLVLLELCVAIGSAPAGIAVLALVGSQTGAITHTTPIVRNTGFNNAVFGGGAGQPTALVDSAATVAAVQTVRAVGGGPAATGSVGTAFIKDEIAGAVVLAPGACVSLQAFTTAISVIASLTWAEVPI
jgi:hypothetical protein